MKSHYVETVTKLQLTRDGFLDTGLGDKLTGPFYKKLVFSKMSG